MDTIKKNEVRQAIQMAAEILAAHGHFVIHVHVPEEKCILGLTDFENEVYSEFIEDLPYWAENAKKENCMVYYDLNEKKR